jgi:hypothetical protein
VDQSVAKSGIPTVGFFVQVPHYVTGSYPSGVLALLRRVEQHLDITLNLEPFVEEEQTHRRQLDEIIADRPEAQEHVQALEKMQAEQQVVSGEDLASEIERYLKDMGRP